MNRVRLGIIGMGGIGKHHAEYLRAGEIGRCELVAVCSSSPAKLENYKPLKIFGDGGQLIRSGEVDAVIIATPHYQHTALGIEAFQKGLHVMMEKPISAHKADAERLIAARQQRPELKFAGMFQLRTEPRYQKIQELVQAGKLGEMVRINWIATDWYRTGAYYASGGWRATWLGEGGGVLLNQSLHNLDMLAWLFGPPSRVRGFCQFGRFHHIEVEDNATAYLEWANGAAGTFATSTGEAPGTNRLEIAGTLGKLVLENNRLTVTRNESDMIEFSKTAKLPLARPEARSEEISFEVAPNPHAVVMKNFVNAILDGKPLIAAGEEGIHSLELANALVYSTLLGQTVELPLDGAAWAKKLNQLIAESKVRK